MLDLIVKFRHLKPCIFQKLAGTLSAIVQLTKNLGFELGVQGAEPSVICCVPRGRWRLKLTNLVQVLQN